MSCEFEIRMIMNKYIKKSFPIVSSISTLAQSRNYNEQFDVHRTQMSDTLKNIVFVDILILRRETKTIGRTRVESTIE